MIQKKVCMLGGFAVGKTSLVARFVSSLFSEKYLSTVGVKVDKKAVHVDGRDVTLMIWDIYGQDEFQTVQHSQLRGMAGYLLVIDGTRRGTDRTQVISGDVVGFDQSGLRAKFRRHVRQRHPLLHRQGAHASAGIFHGLIFPAVHSEAGAQMQHHVLGGHTSAEPPGPFDADCLRHPDPDLAGRQHAGSVQRQLHRFHVGRVAGFDGLLVVGERQFVLLDPLETLSQFQQHDGPAFRVSASGLESGDGRLGLAGSLQPQAQLELQARIERLAISPRGVDLQLHLVGLGACALKQLFSVG